MGRAASGRSAALHAATTPGRVRASRMSIARMRAWPWGLRTTPRCSNPSRVMSSRYRPAPTRRRRSSFRRGELPIRSLVWSMPRSVPAGCARERAARLTSPQRRHNVRRAHPSCPRRLARPRPRVVVAGRRRRGADRVARRARMGAAGDRALRAPDPSTAADRVGGRGRLPVLGADTRAEGLHAGGAPAPRARARGGRRAVQPRARQSLPDGRGQHGAARRRRAGAGCGILRWPRCRSARAAASSSSRGGRTMDRARTSSSATGRSS